MTFFFVHFKLWKSSFWLDLPAKPSKRLCVGPDRSLASCPAGGRGQTAQGLARRPLFMAEIIADSLGPPHQCCALSATPQLSIQSKQRAFLCVPFCVVVDPIPKAVNAHKCQCKIFICQNNSLNGFLLDGLLLDVQSWWRLNLSHRFHGKNYKPSGILPRFSFHISSFVVIKSLPQWDFAR